jgi:transcriptional regulator GlxA family with amidase domain
VFRRHLNTTPTAYLRQVRLARAHAGLLAATPGDGQTVTAIAERWGFPSASRFTARYREAYGVPPSRTLRQP